MGENICVIGVWGVRPDVLILKEGGKMLMVVLLTAMFHRLGLILP